TAHEHVFGLAVGIDFTRRDIQREMKQGSHPWDMAKGFDHGAPVSALLQKAALENFPPQGAITLTVNGETRQDGRLADMLWSPAEIIAALSRLMRLYPGDIIFTDTPAGVGPVFPGDRVEAAIQDIGKISVTIA